IILLILARVLTRITLPSTFFSTLLWYITPVISLVALFLQIGSNALYDNFAFHTFHLHPEPLKAVALFLCIVLLASWQPAVARQRPQWSSFVLPVILICQTVFLKWAYVGTWWPWLKQE